MHTSIIAIIVLAVVVATAYVFHRHVQAANAEVKTLKAAADKAEVDAILATAKVETDVKADVVSPALVEVNKLIADADKVVKQ